MSHQPKWYETSYRRNLVDMHIEDWDERFLSKLDPETYISLLKKAHIQSAMLYANSHLGYCYWPTKTGHVHRGIGKKDILGELIRRCHREGMHAIPYYSLLYNNWAYEQHPSWRLVNANGKSSREEGGADKAHGMRYGVCCPNNLEYRAFTEAQIAEISEGYDFEGFFFDMNFWPDICYCSSCAARFEKEVGGEIPTVIDWTDSRWQEFQSRREEWIAEHARFATGLVKKFKPEVSVEHNSASFTRPWKRAVTLSLVAANDYIGGDLYGGFLEQSIICKLYQSVTPNPPFEYMTSRCYPNVRDHTTTKSKEMLEMHTMIALAHNGAFLFIDAIDPDGTLDPKVYDTIGDIFDKSAKYEKYLGGNLCADVGIYFSLNSKPDVADNGTPVADSEGGYLDRGPHLEAVIGAARALKENHIPFGIISRTQLPHLARHQVIVLPDVQVFDDNEREAMREYVRNGGSVYASGRTASLLPDVFGLVHEGEFADAISYIAPTHPSEDLLPAIDAINPLSVHTRQFKARALPGGDVRATAVLPFTMSADTRRFASIHSNPHGPSTGYPAVVCRTFGRGKVLWVAASIETADKEPHKRSFVAMIKHLARAPFTFESQAPPAVEIVAFHQPNRHRYLINVLNQQELLPAVPATTVKVGLRMKSMKTLAVLLLPEEKRLPFEIINGLTTFAVPPVDIMQMIAVDYD